MIDFNMFDAGLTAALGVSLLGWRLAAVKARQWEKECETWREYSDKKDDLIDNLRKRISLLGQPKKIYSQQTNEKIMAQQQRASMRPMRESEFLHTNAMSQSNLAALGLGALAGGAVGYGLARDTSTQNPFTSGDGGDYAGAGATGSWPAETVRSPQPLDAGIPTDDVCKASDYSSPAHNDSSSWSSSDSTYSDSSSSSSSFSSD